MNKSNKISKKLEALQLETANLFSELLKTHKAFDFLKVEMDAYPEFERVDVLNQGVLPLVEMRNEVTGNIFDIYVERVHDNGLTVSTTDEFEVMEIKFSDLASIEDQLVLLNEMEGLKEN